MDSPLIQAILVLIGVAAQEVQALTKPESTANQVAGLSSDMLTAIRNVAAKHAENVGLPIDQVLSQL